MSTRKLTTKEFIERARQVHGMKYCYALVNYVNGLTDVIIICPEHGQFKQRAINHLNGRGCKICGEIKRINQLTFSTEEWIKKAQKIHGDRYNYNNSNYIKNNIKIEIICSVHGSFWQEPHSHIRGQGCPKCKADKERLTCDEFIEKAKKVHGNFYNYSKVNYKGNRFKICIICPDHGEFWQTAAGHLKGSKCPICQESIGEAIIRSWLEQNNIKFIKEYKFEDCKYKNLLRFDFYLPDYTSCIEFDGAQHYKPYLFSSDKSEETMKKNLEFMQLKDQIKNQYCLDNGIKLLRIPYWKQNNIGKILDNYFGLLSMNLKDFN